MVNLEREKDGKLKNFICCTYLYSALLQQFTLRNVICVKIDVENYLNETMELRNDRY